MLPGGKILQLPSRLEYPNIGSVLQDDTHWSFLSGRGAQGNVAHHVEIRHVHAKKSLVWGRRKIRGLRKQDVFDITSDPLELRLDCRYLYEIVDEHSHFGGEYSLNLPISNFHKHFSYMFAHAL